MEVKGDEDFTNQVIRKVCQNNVGWRINIRNDYQKSQGKYDNYNRGPPQTPQYGGMDYKPRDNYNREPRDPIQN